MESRRAEAIAYAVAIIVLVAGGAVFRTMFLNWFVGPMTVVVSVALIPPLLERRRHR